MTGKKSATDIRLEDMQHKINEDLYDVLIKLEKLHEAMSLRNIPIEDHRQVENTKQLVFTRIASGLYDGKNLDLNKYLG